MDRDDMSRTTEDLRVRRATYRRVTISPRLSRDYESCSSMYIVERGSANLGFHHSLTEGDVVLLPRGEAHTLETQTESVQILAATFELVRPDHPVLQTLPAIIHIPSQWLASPTWSALRTSLDAELAYPPSHPGRETMLVRITDVMLIEAMRGRPPRGAECPRSNVIIPPDDTLRRVLSAIHESPESAWSVAALANLAGQSRSAFAAHFASVMKEPPMAYVGRWRMFRARTLLRGNDLSLDEIATTCGYGSAAAFSLAFTREHGMTPGAFRRDATTAE